MDAQNNLERFLDIKESMARKSGCAGLLFALGVDDPIEKYMTMRQDIVMKYGSVGDILDNDEYNYQLQVRDKYIFRTMAKEAGVLPYALFK